MPKLIAALIIALCAAVRDCLYMAGELYWRVYWFIKRKGNGKG